MFNGPAAPCGRPSAWCDGFGQLMWGIPGTGGVPLGASPQGANLTGMFLPPGCMPPAAAARPALQHPGGLPNASQQVGDSYTPLCMPRRFQDSTCLACCATAGAMLQLDSYLTVVVSCHGIPAPTTSALCAGPKGCQVPGCLVTARSMLAFVLTPKHVLPLLQMLGSWPPDGWPSALDPNAALAGFQGAGGVLPGGHAPGEPVWHLLLAYSNTMHAGCQLGGCSGLCSAVL